MATEPGGKTLQQIRDLNEAELEKSKRVAGQLQGILQQLKQKRDEIASQNAKLREARPKDDLLDALEMQAESSKTAKEMAERDRDECAAQLAELRAQLEAEESFCELRQSELAEHRAEEARFEEGTAEAAARRDQAEKKLRSMVHKDTLETCRDNFQRVDERLQEADAETSKLRQALADAWAARADDSSAPTGEEELKRLGTLEEDLQWLSDMQQEAAAEVHRVQHLERSEQRLQRQLQDSSEENARLQSHRVDLGDAGKSLREAMASTNERATTRVEDLAADRQKADADRGKLIQECASLQAKLNELQPQLEGLDEIEQLHRERSMDCENMRIESARLQEINASLSVLVMGDEGLALADPTSTALRRMLDLYKRLIEREESQAQEKQRLVDRIMQLERQAARGVVEEEEKPPEAPASSSSSSKSGLSKMGKSLTKGLGKLLT